MPLKDALNRVIADYNKLVTLKRHRVDSARRAMCYNLFLIVINSCLYFFLTGHFNFQTVMFFPPKRDVDLLWLARLVQDALSRGSIGIASSPLRLLQARSFRRG